MPPRARRRVARVAALLRRTDAGDAVRNLLLHDVARVLEMLTDPGQAAGLPDVAVRYPPAAYTAPARGAPGPRPARPEG